MAVEGGGRWRWREWEGGKSNVAVLIGMCYGNMHDVLPELYKEGDRYMSP